MQAGEWTSPHTKLCRDNRRTTSWRTLDKRTALKAQMLAPCVDLIWTIISRDSQNSCRKKRKHSSRVWMHWKKPQHSQICDNGKLNGDIGELSRYSPLWRRYEHSPVPKHWLFCVTFDKSFKVIWSQGAPPHSLQSTAALSTTLHFPGSLNPLFHAPACLTWGFSVTASVFSGRTTVPDTRGLQVWRGQKTGQQNT